MLSPTGQYSPAPVIVQTTYNYRYIYFSMYYKFNQLAINCIYVLFIFIYIFFFFFFHVFIVVHLLALMRGSVSTNEHMMNLIVRLVRQRHCQLLKVQSHPNNINSNKNDSAYMTQTIIELFSLASYSYTVGHCYDINFFFFLIRQTNRPLL